MSGARIDIPPVGPARRELLLDYFTVTSRAAQPTDALADHHAQAMPAGRPFLIPHHLDLLDFPSLVGYQPDYSVYTVRQASRRSWRIGQCAPVEVTYLVYAQTLQADALGLIAANVHSALNIEGELPEDGLAALDGDNTDVFLALARRLTERSNTEDQPLEKLFASARWIEGEADEYLVDANWASSDGKKGAPELWAVCQPLRACPGMSRLFLLLSGKQAYDRYLV